MALSTVLMLNDSKQLIQMQARKMAQTVASQVLAERKYYVSTVAKKLEGTSWAAREGSAGAPEHVPLPATFVMSIASDVSSAQSSYQYGLVSRWNINSGNSISG